MVTSVVKTWLRASHNSTSRYASNIILYGGRLLCIDIYEAGVDGT